MRHFYFYFIIVPLILYSSIINAQVSNSSESSQWSYYAEVNFYFADPFIFLPVFQADKSKLHLEARYNYEEMNTFSGWVGYNFEGGKKFEYKIVPMAGGIIGDLNGTAAGLEMTFDFAGFEFYSESEFIFDFSSSENNFYYNYSDFTYSPFDWINFGITFQRTIIYEADSDSQGGFILGGSYNNWELSGNLISVAIDDPFFQLTIAKQF